MSAAVAAFWAEASAACGLDGACPQAWSFGGTPEQADALLALVLDGTKTATAGALWDYEVNAEAVPRPGDLNVVLDGVARPRVLIRDTDVRVVPFEDVDVDHARLEGEGDLSLRFWREAHERFFTTFADHDRGFSPTMPVVLQRFEVLFVAER